MPSDVMAQLLARRAELKRDLGIYEAAWRAGGCRDASDTTEIRINTIEREIAEYERAITMLIPRRLDA